MIVAPFSFHSTGSAKRKPNFQIQSSEVSIFGRKPVLIDVVRMRYVLMDFLGARSYLAHRQMSVGVEVFQLNFGVASRSR